METGLVGSLETETVPRGPLTDPAPDDPENREPDYFRAVPPHETWDRVARVLLFVAVFFSSWWLARVGDMNLTLADLAFIGALGILFVQGRLTLMPFGALTPYWLFGLMLMLGGLFVSTVVNGDPLRWANIASQYLLAYLGVPLLLMQRPPDLVKRLPVLFMLGTTLSEVIGIVASFFLTFHDTVDMLGDGFITGNGRLGSMAGQPNPNGAMIAYSMPMLIYALNKKIIPRPVGLVCGALLATGLIMSASFTGFFATISAVGFMLLVMGFRHMVRVGAVVLAAVALFFASGAPLPAVFQHRVGNAVETGNIDEAGTFVHRSELIVEAWKLAEKNSVIGMGVDRYRDLSAYDNPVHNLYLLIWNEGGMVALAGLVTLFGLLGVLAANGLWRDRIGGAMAISAVFVFLVYTMSFPHMYSRMWVMPIMVALSVLYSRNTGTRLPMVMRRTKETMPDGAILDP